MRCQMGEAGSRSRESERCGKSADQFACVGTFPLCSTARMAEQTGESWHVAGMLLLMLRRHRYREARAGADAQGRACFGDVSSIAHALHVSRAA